MKESNHIDGDREFVGAISRSIMAANVLGAFSPEEGRRW